MLAPAALAPGLPPRLLLLGTFCCRAARRAAAWAGDSRAESGPRGMLLRVGERCWVLGRAVSAPLACCCAREAGEGEGTGMRLLGACGRAGGRWAVTAGCVGAQLCWGGGSVRGVRRAPWVGRGACRAQHA